MIGHEGYYSVVQYCPDRFRAEAANVGVVLFSPTEGRIRAEVSERAGRAEKMFRLKAPEVARLATAAKALANRINSGKSGVTTKEEFRTFIESRPHEILLTSPRLVKITDFSQELHRLFEKLVEEREREAAARPAKRPDSLRRLEDALERLVERGLATRAEKVRVPVIDEELEVPFAYRNGALNLVKPQELHTGRSGAQVSFQLAVEGDLLYRHPEGEGTRRLVVVSAGEPNARTARAEQEATPLFEQYHVRLVKSTEVDAYAVEVEAEAHR